MLNYSKWINTGFNINVFSPLPNNYISKLCELHETETSSSIGLEFNFSLKDSI